VYSIVVCADSCSPPLAPNGLRWAWIHHESALRGLPVTNSAIRTFTRLAARGSVGIGLLSSRECVARAWMSTPHARLPAHLPAWLGRNYWIHSCRTNEAFRGQGLYTSAVRYLLAHAAAQSAPASVEVFIDTTPNNEPSKRAIQRAGFEYRGTIVTYRLPKTGLSFARWIK